MTDPWEVAKALLTRFFLADPSVAEKKPRDVYEMHREFEKVPYNSFRSKWNTMSFCVFIDLKS